MICKEISKIYENVFYCIPYSIDYSIKYTDLLEYLIAKKNTANTEKILKDKHIQVTFWQLENLNKLGREDEFINFKRKYENLLVKYDVSENEKIKYEIYKIKNLEEYNDISKKEKKSNISFKPT